jgi:hypothetical protein
MAKKEEMEALWARLSERLASDPKLTEVIDSIEKSVNQSFDEKPRRRLKVPYANATTLETWEAWH